MKIDVWNRAEKYRNFDDHSQQQLFQKLAGTVTGMSWGIRNPKIFENVALRFMVNGHHHKGHVYIFVTPGDLFDVFYTTQKGRTIKKSEDIYVGEILQEIDREVEKIPAYSR